MKLTWLLLCAGSLNLLACGAPEAPSPAPLGSDLANEAGDDDDAPARKKSKRTESERDEATTDATLPEPAAAAPAAVPVEKTAQPDGTVLHAANGYEVTVDKQDPKVPDATVDAILGVYFQVYGPMRDRFDPNAPLHTTIIFDPTYDGVAATDTRTATIRYDPSYVIANPKDLDVVTHEAFHVIQDYDHYTEAGCPGWAVEGFADWARFRFGVKNAYAGWSLPKPTAANKPTDSYRVTARFFAWLEDNVSKDFPRKLHAVLKANIYSDAFWTRSFAKSLDELWAEYVRASG